MQYTNLEHGLVFAFEITCVARGFIINFLCCPRVQQGWTVLHRKKLALTNNGRLMPKSIFSVFEYLYTM